MKTQYFTATSIDGFIADLQHSLNWLFQFADGSGEFYANFIKDVGAIAMGSSTYEWLLANEIYKDPDSPKPWPYTQPTWVFTTRLLKTIENAEICFVSGDVRPVYAEMKVATKGKNIWLAGGGELVGQFYDQGLLDEIFISIAPVFLGSGARLFPRKLITPPLKLLSAQPEGEFVHLHYELVREKIIS